MLGRHSNKEVDPLWLSFIAGALSASVVWSLGWAARHMLFSRDRYSSRRYPKLFHGRDDEDSDDDDDESNASDDEDFPESPTRRESLVRWPWDTIRNSVINASASFLNLDMGDDRSDVSITEKTGPCIGEIFGLDVGGTLTKLVYFEQQIREYKRQESHEGFHRREHYNMAASALEVLQARRSTASAGATGGGGGNVITRHNTDSDVDLQGLWGMRQESVPDNLHEFASSNNIASPERGGIQSTKSEEQGNGHNGQQSEQQQSSGDHSSGGGMGMKRSRSMINLSKSTEHAEVLDNFYSFARRLDTYETAVKDKHLSYYSRYLNGTFHFIRFETRRMKNAMNLMVCNHSLMTFCKHQVQNECILLY